MSRRSFIITALMINLTICVTLCIVLFTGNGGNNINNNINNINNNANTIEEKSAGQPVSERPENQAIVNIEDISDIEDYPDDDGTTAKIIESQVESDTQPYNYKSVNSSENVNNHNEQGTAEEQVTQEQGADGQGLSLQDSNEQERNGQDSQSQQSQNEQASEITQTPNAEETIVVNGTKAVISSSCNIRSGADVGNNIIGEADTGAEYRIEPSQCTENWVAIYIDDTTVGYVSTAFCNIQ